ncbi:MAG: hypothetical protein DRI57_12885 [Deltaproteobacteria bacterium]|nr:MAG: hypothetical protein DRI57_12885 [Deltaproteobacteria bacterium]
MENIEKIKRVLEKLRLEELEIDMEESGSGKIGGFSVSKIFEGMSQLERQNYIYGIIWKKN